MESIQPYRGNPGAADPLKQHACLVAYVRFVDQNVRPFYSRDVGVKGTGKYHHKGYWLTYLKNMIEFERPTGWKGRVIAGGIFHCFDGNKGDRICQWDAAKGFWVYDQQLC